MDTEVMESLPCHLKMLPREYRGWAEQDRLLMARDAFKGSEEGNLCFSESDITGNKPVPRMRTLPIQADIFPRLPLALCIRIRETLPERLFPLWITWKSKSRTDSTF